MLDTRCEEKRNHDAQRVVFFRSKSEEDLDVLIGQFRRQGILAAADLPLTAENQDIRVESKAKMLAVLERTRIPGKGICTTAETED